MKKPLTRSGRESRQPDSVEPPKRELGGERRFRPCLPGIKGSKFGLEISQRERALVAAVLPDREGVIRLFVAVDDDERDLLDLGVPDALADGLVGVVDLDTVRLEARGKLDGSRPVALADRNH